MAVGAALLLALAADRRCVSITRSLPRANQREEPAILGNPASFPPLSPPASPFVAHTSPKPLANELSNLNEELIIQAERWGQIDPASAAAWAVTLPSDSTRCEVLTTVSALWAQSDPASAASSVLDLPPGPDREAAVEAIAVTWARSQPAVAAQWVEGRSISGPPPALVERLLLTWAESDPLAAVEWSLHLPDDLARDVATRSLCNAIHQRYPALALELAETTADDEARQALIATW